MGTAQKRNITFSLPESVIREAKILAARDDKSLNALVQEILESKLQSESTRQEAVRQIFSKRFQFRGCRKFSREELYDRTRLL